MNFLKFIKFFKPQEEQNASRKITPPKTKRMYFECKGETADNPNGKNRQDLIKKILKNYKKEMDKSDLYGGYTNKEILDMYESVSEFEGETFDGNYEITTYKNSPSIIINMNDVDDTSYPVANIAKEDIDKFLNLINNYKILHFEIEVNGGKIKYPTNGSVETKELNYGIEVIITYKLNETDFSK